MRRDERKDGENRIKLVAADMDGTLLNRERKITKYTQNVIKKAMAQGVYFVPATGRAVNALPPELKEMEGIRYGIFSNGATIYDLKEEKVIKDTVVSAASHRENESSRFMQPPFKIIKNRRYWR